MNEGRRLSKASLKMQVLRLAALAQDDNSRVVGEGLTR
jgi:hypothetical protein